MHSSAIGYEKDAVESAMHVEQSKIRQKHTQNNAFLGWQMYCEEKLIET